MAITNNPILKKASGRIGNIVFRQVGGQTFMSERPGKRTYFTEGQLKTQANFRKAGLYAKEKLADPAVKAAYMAKALATGHTNARIMAVQEYLLSLDKS
jgi:hypothetical protein